MIRAVCPGSFDPLTNGHLDIITRAARQFDELIVAVVDNPSKECLFNMQERIAMIEEATQHIDNIITDQFSGMLVRYMDKMNSKIIVKGLRAVSDFEYEFQMALMNRKLAPDFETFFMMSHNRYSYLSSSLVKEVFSLGGCVSGLVPPYVEQCLKEKSGVSLIPTAIKTNDNSKSNSD